MAKMGVVEVDPPPTAARTAEVKKELKRLMRAIVEGGDDDLTLENIDKAKEALSVLGDLKGKKKTAASFKLADGDGGDVGDVSGSYPEEFRCPLSKQLMRDPVIIANGQTYDRPFIQNWLNSGNRTCPQTQQVLSHTLLTPNHLIRDLISKWCRTHSIEFPDRPDPIADPDSSSAVLLTSDRDRFFSLLNRMSSTSISDQKSAAKELRLLTKKIPAFRALFGESAGSISQLLSPLLHPTNNNNNNNSSSTANHHHRRDRNVNDPDLQEDLITTLLNISIHDSNKKLVCETPMALPLLIDALKHGTIETRSNSAAALFTLSALDSNKSLIGKSGALGPLIDLLGEGNPLAVKDAASAIFNLCILHENKSRAVNEGAVSVLLSKIKAKVHEDELLAILAMLSSHQGAVEEMGELGAVQQLLGIVREGGACARSKENCVAILYVVCLSDRTKLREVREEEEMYGTLSKLAEEGTSRARRKANGILEKVNRAVNLQHTA